MSKQIKDGLNKEWNKQKSSNQCGTSGEMVLNGLLHCINNLSTNISKLELDLDDCWTKTNNGEDIVECMKKTHHNIYDIKNKLDHNSKTYGGCKINKCIKPQHKLINNKMLFNNEKKSIIKQQPNVPLKNKNLDKKVKGKTQAKKKISNVKKTRDIIASINDKLNHSWNKKYSNKCGESAHSMLINLSKCLDNIDKIISNIDNSFISCIKNSKNSDDVAKCMEDVHNSTEGLVGFIDNNNACNYLKCFTNDNSDSKKIEKNRGFKKCIGSNNVSFEKFTNYLKEINKKTSKLNLEYINCLNSDVNDTVNYEGCLNSISNHLEDFKNKLDNFCDLIIENDGNKTKMGSRDISDNSKLNKLYEEDLDVLQSICNKYRTELINTLKSCGHDTSNIPTVKNTNECVYQINTLTKKLSSCLVNTDSTLEGKISQLERDVLSSLNNVANKKVNSSSKCKGKKCKNQDGKKKSDCKPWQLCWIKESGYNPMEDVHNIYYGFKDSCQTALHPLEGCDPSKAVYFAPPPAGF